MARLNFNLPTHGLLLGVLILLIIASPELPDAGSGIVFELFFDLVLLAGVRSVGPSKHRIPFLLLTVLTLGLRWGEQLTGTGVLDVSALGLTVVWLVYAIWIVVGHLFRRREVTLNTIFGAIVAYLLIAMAFAMVFTILEVRHPGSFSGLPDTQISHRNELYSAIMYYSLVCFTTMGFGDVVPVSSLARSLSAVAGVLGQLYLAVMIARLVGLHIAHTSRNDDF
ncbi:MAG: potassium channel family protein [Myxococcota bacterium]